MTEAAPKVSPPSEETEKIIIPTDEEEKKDTKQLILTILGYVSLIFIALSLFFPFWNWRDGGTYHFVSLWQGTTAGVPFNYWITVGTLISELFAKISAPASPVTFGLEQVWAIGGVNVSLMFIIFLIVYFWKRKFPATGFFTASILLGGAYGVGFAFYTDFSYSYIPTSLYGPTWGLAFGWWALFIGGMIALIRKQYLKKIKREEKEKAEGLTFKV